MVGRRSTHLYRFLVNRVIIVFLRMIVRLKNHEKYLLLDFLIIEVMKRCEGDFLCCLTGFYNSPEIRNAIPAAWPFYDKLYQISDVFSKIRFYRYAQE
jgi:hypothetical protein